MKIIMELNFNQLSLLAQDIKTLGQNLGFAQVGITNIDLTLAEERLKRWLAKAYHGEMDFMQRHGTLRSRPAELLPGTLRVISARMDYRPPQTKFKRVLSNSHLAFISRYALGRDYHKLIRKRLAKLMTFINERINNLANFRVFADSAPVMEKPLAEKAGLGWIGKSTNLIHPKAGSWFFLGTIYTNLPLPIDNPAKAHCGSCTACLKICPTGAIVRPFELDARRCISYLTIELKGSIPLELRSLIGNRIYGCDDCQIVCPWNKFSRPTNESAFLSRHQLDEITLLELFAWDEAEFEQKMVGSAIRRIGYQRWQRNLAVALGNATPSAKIVEALTKKREQASPLVKEHIDWALQRQI